MNHLNSNDILTENQHGFQACVTQLLSLTENISYVLDHKQQIDIVLLDFAKEFDINNFPPRK